MIKKLQLAAVAAMMSFGATAQIYVTAPYNRTGIGTNNPQNVVHVRNPNDGDQTEWSGIRLAPATSSSTGIDSYHQIIGYRKSGLLIAGGATGNYAHSNMWFKDDGIWFTFSDGGYTPETHPLLYLKNCIGNTYYLTLGTYNGYPCLYPNSNNQGYLGTPNNKFSFIYTDRLYLKDAEFTSDENAKENIQPLKGSLQRVCATKAYTYDFKSDKQQETTLLKSADKLITQASITEEPKNKAIPGTQTTPDVISNEINTAVTNEINKNEIQRKQKIGFVAQDLQKTFPELVRFNEESGLYTVDYIGMIPALLESIKEQQTQIATQQQTVASQKTLLAAQQQQITAQQAQIDELIKAVNKLKR